MRHCIYPGTFDPITYGHLDVLKRAAKLFDRVTVAIAENAGKAPLITSAQRLEMVRTSVAKYPHVSVTTFGGLLVEFCMAQKAAAIIRGLRALSELPPLPEMAKEKPEYCALIRPITGKEFDDAIGWAKAAGLHRGF